MASIRTDARKDGTVAYRVFYRDENRRQCSYTFDDLGTSEAFKVTVDKLGAERAVALHRLDRLPRATTATTALTVGEWVKLHTEGLSGVQPDTRRRYQRYLANDIAPVLGRVPLADLTEHDVSLWIQGLSGSAKTVTNKTRFLAGALNNAVKLKHVGSNVATGAKVPRTERREHVYLTREQFAVLLTEVPDVWTPLVEFLVVSGCRWSEATALRPSDVNRAAGTVRISRAWKDGHVLGPTKTDGSTRTINVPKTVLDKLDYDKAYLFTNPGNGAGGPNAKRNGAGGPVRNQNFARNVWIPACERAKLDPRPRIHDTRHTCASWLIQQGIPLPVVQKHLGHEDIKTTVGVYGHLDRRSAQAAADVMGTLLPT
jgi:integrase